MPSRPVAPAVTVGLLTSAMTVATVFYSMVALLATFILDDLGATRAQLGWVVAAHSIASAALSPSIGAIADRLGAKRSMLGVYAFSGIGFVLMARVNALATMIAAGLVISLAQSMVNPATNKMIAKEFLPGKRGLITGVKQSGVQVGIIVAGISFPALAIAHGWRSVPVVVGTVALALLAVAAWMLPADSTTSSLTHTERRPPLPPGIYWITAYAFLMGVGGSPIFSFFPLYAQEAIGVSETMAGLIVAVGGLVAVIARIASSVRVERTGEYSRAMMSLAGMAVGSGILLILAQPLGVVMLWISAVAAFMSISAWNSVAMLSVINAAGPAGAGRAAGTISLGFLSGLAFSPPLFGWSVDRLETYQPGFIAIVFVFALATLTMWIWRRRQ